MRKNLTTVDEVVEALGGTTAVADRLGIGPSAVSNWRARGSIARAKFVVISRALAAVGKQADDDLFGFQPECEARR